MGDNICSSKSGNDIGASTVGIDADRAAIAPAAARAANRHADKKANAERRAAIAAAPAD